jgi:EKC/KEOPS complex subunit CGI121/TPRKB
LKSRNVHSEIVFALSPNNNVGTFLILLPLALFVDNCKIAESFRRFGLTDATRDLLVIKVSTSPEINHDTVAQHLKNVIEGTPCPFDNENLRLVSRVAKIKAAYKVGPPSSSPSQETGHDEQKRIEMSIIGSMALRGAA